jgi:hypothetical protein
MRAVPPIGAGYLIEGVDWRLAQIKLICPCPLTQLADIRFRW